MKSKIYIRAIISMAAWTGVLLMLSISCLKKDCCDDLNQATIPILTTDTISSITHSTAQCGGSITSDGGDTINARGVCWSLIQSPTIADSITSDSIGLGSFSSSITGLTASTIYYVCAYATNRLGTAYGEQQSFTTLQSTTMPTVTTDAVVNITQTSATSGGYVIADGGDPVTVRGLCWNTLPNPTISDNYTTDGSGVGPFNSYMTGLTQNTIFYIRAYASNSIGTAYGNQITCLTADAQSCPGTPTFSYGGQIYYTVQIGTQCWMKENLNIGTRINGTEDQTNDGEIEKYCYDDLEANCDVYGGLYQWDELMQYTTTPGVQGICPSGWHIPEETEFETLINYLGDEATAGGEMKSIGSIEAGNGLWHTPNTGATNGSGFTGLPGGFRDELGDILWLGYYGPFWSSTETLPYGVSRELQYNKTKVQWNGRPKIYGLSIRCLKD